MERYSALSYVLFDEKTDTRRIATTKYPKIPYRDSDLYIFAKAGQRMDILAFQYYGDQTLWWIIAEANLIGKGKFSLPLGGSIRIPYPIDPLFLNDLLTFELENE